MSPRLQIALKHVLGAACFCFDWRTGFFGTSLLLVFLFFQDAIRAAFRRPGLAASLALVSPYLVWIAVAIAAGVLSNKFAQAEVGRIADRARDIKVATGKYPESLKEITSYSGAVDLHGHLHAYESHIFLSKGCVVYRKFPGSWVTYNLESKTETRSDWF
jgi:hypothetical protein